MRKWKCFLTLHACQSVVGYSQNQNYIFKLVTEAWAQLLNCQTEIWIRAGRTKKKRFLKVGTLLLSLFYLYACAAELLYKHNITSVAMAVCQHNVPNPVLFPDKICAPAIHRNIQVHCKRQHTVKNEKCIWFKMTSGCVNDDRFFICVWPIAVTSITHLWQSC